MLLIFNNNIEHVAENEKQNNTQVEANWESMAQHYQAPEWFIDGKIGIWTHWPAGGRPRRN